MIRDVRNVFLAVAVALILFATLGCSTLRQVAEKIEAPAKAAKLVDTYCDEVPHAARLETRTAVNSLTTRGDVRIDCDGDPAE